MLLFVSDDGKIEYQGEVEAIVCNMPGMDFILGLPDITRHFVELLTSMLRVSQEEVSSTALETDMLPGDVKLLSDGEVEESSEEIETPMPVAFGPVLAFMETSYDEARAEYFNMLKNHVGEQLARCPKFIKNRRSTNVHDIK